MGLEGIFDEEVEVEAPERGAPEKEEAEKEEPRREEPEREETKGKVKAKESFEETVEKIVKRTGRERDEILSLVEKKQKELMGFVPPEGAAALIAKELDVDLEKPIEEKPEKKIAEEKPAEKPEEKVVEKKPAIPPPSAPKKETQPEEAELTEAKGTAKCNFMIYGLKGSGKTYMALSPPGKIACLSFDKKSLPIKQYSFDNDDRIKIYDAIALMNYASPESWTESADLTFKRLNLLISKIAEWGPDWIVVDGSEILQRICEMTMRYRNNLMAFQGVANRNLWKERRMYIRQVHDRCFDAAKKGVIYTTYTAKDEIVREGEFIVKDDLPKWIDAIMWQTDTVIRVRSVQEKSGRKFYATIESSKFPPFKTGREVDITDKGVSALLGTTATEVNP